MEHERSQGPYGNEFFTKTDAGQATVWAPLFYWFGIPPEVFVKIINKQDSPTA